VGKSQRVSLGVVADIGTTLRALDERLATRMTEGQRSAASQRVEAMRAQRATLVSQSTAAAEADATRAPISQAFLMHTLGAVMPAGAVVVDESATSLGHVLRYLPSSTPDSFFGGKTGTLGWGMGAAIGVQLALPKRKIVATIGDGSMMYAPQALWTAARYKLPITYVVPNNSSYAILKAGMLGMGLPSAKKGLYPGMDLVDPTIDNVALARAMGVRAERVERPSELRDVLTACLAHGGPSLVDVVIDRGFKAIA
jgi:benzoylformate decarboxylase